ncbi:acetylornithine deacetylase [Actinomycetes bacterium NPDC127524]
MEGYSELASIISRKAEEKSEELLQLLTRLISFPTISPPARNTASIQDYMDSYLKELGFQTEKWELYPGDWNIAGILPGKSSNTYNSLIIIGHVDVAETGDICGWDNNPFTVNQKGPYLYGRGAADMKGGIAASLMAIKLLKELDIPLNGDLQFQSVTGEEAGETGTLSCIERGYTADFAIVADTSDMHIQGQGGVITGWITIQGKETFHDGLRSRMNTAGGGIFGASAIEKMMKIIESLQELERHWAVTKSYAGFPPGSNTINPAVIEGGRHAAFIADRCSLWITVHFYPDENHEKVTMDIENHVRRAAASDPWLSENMPVFKWGGKSMLEERGEIFPSLELDLNHIGTQTLMSSYSEQLAEKPRTGMSSSVNDAGWFGYKGIPSVIFGPGKLEDTHAVNEKIEFRQLIDFMKVMALFISKWCNTKKEGNE